jgi:hypothetical protein
VLPAARFGCVRKKVNTCGLSNLSEVFLWPWEPASFGGSRRFIRIAAEGGASMGDELGAAGLNEIAGLGDDVLKQLDQLTHAGFVINDLRCRLEKPRWVCVSLQASLENNAALFGSESNGVRICLPVYFSSYWLLALWLSSVSRGAAALPATSPAV